MAESVPNPKILVTRVILNSRLILFYFVYVMRCLIFSANALFGRCLADGLSQHAAVRSAEYSADIDTISHLASRMKTSIILVDLADEAGRAGISTLRRRLTDTCFMGLSVDETAADDVLASARLGCNGIVPRNATLEDVVRISLAAMRGEVVVSPTVAASMMRALARPERDPNATDDPTGCLTRREREICSLVCDGLTNKEIAREVNRSVGTVKNHVRSILSKFDVPRRTALTAHLRR